MSPELETDIAPTINSKRMGVAEDVEMEQQNIGIDPTSKRKSSVLARQKVSNLIAHFDDEIYIIESSDDAEPQPKKSKSASTTSYSKRKGEWGVLIGHYINDAEMPVRARYYPNGSLNFRVYREECSKEVLGRWVAFFSNKARCTVGEIQFDPVTFGVDMQALKRDKKKERVREYLATHKGYSLQTLPERSATDENSESTSKEFTPMSWGDEAKAVDSSHMKPVTQSNHTADYSKDIQIGHCFVDELTLPAYAFIKTYDRGYSSLVPALCFRLHKDDVDEETQARASYPKHGATIHFDKIQLNKKFDRGSEKDTKNYIKSLIYTKPKSWSKKSKGDNSEDDEGIDGESGQVIKSNRVTRKSTRQGAGEGVKSLYGGLGQLHQSAEEGFVDADDEQDSDPGHNYFTRGRRNAANPLSLASHGRESSEDQADEIKKLKTELQKKNQIINDLREEVKFQSTLADKAATQAPSVIDGKRLISGKVYEQLVSGANLGKYRSREWAKVFSDGRVYKEWTVLSEIKLHMGYTGQADKMQLGEMEFLRVPDGENKDMLVQTVGEDSIWEVGDERFIKWTIREEVELEGLNL